MSFIASMLMSGAGALFRAGREAYQRSSEESKTREAAEKAQPNAVTDARAQSLSDKASGKASFAQHYKAQVAKATDTDADGKISKDELEKQVTAGGGSAKQSEALYKAMDANGDGTVTVDELQNGLPVPPTALAQQIMQMIQAHRAAAGANNNAQGADKSANAVSAPRQAPAIDASLALSKLAAQLPVRS